MSYYRDLNKELVEQIQVMRRTMKIYCDEIINLKKELFEKHETEIFLRKRCYNLAVNNFVQLIQYLQPDSDLLPLLEHHVQLQQNLYPSTHSTGKNHLLTSGTSGRRPSDARSQGSSLAEEMRRSSSLMNLFTSIHNTSPIRKSSPKPNDRVEEEHISPTVQQDAIGENLCNENELTGLLKNIDINRTILEESEKEDEVIDTESEYDEVIDISETRSTLKDLTNTLHYSKNENTHSKIVRKCNQSKVVNRENFKNKENHTNINSTCDKDFNIEQILDNEENFEEPRVCSSGGNAWHEMAESYHINQCSHSKTQVTFSQTDFSNVTLRNLGNFKEAACSTPYTKEEKIFNAEISPTQKEQSSELTLLNNASARPTRRCAPKCLAEPHINRKMRNSTEIKTETKKKPRRNKANKRQ